MSLENKTAYLAEFLATFGLVFFCSMGSILVDANELDLIGVGILNFFVLTFMVYLSFGHSGAHLNPAVTLGFVLTQKMEKQKATFYILSQLLASIVAGLSLLFFAPKFLLDSAVDKSVLGFPHLNPDYGIIQGTALEVLLTFFLVMVIWTVAVDDRIPTYLIGFAVGGTVAFNVVVGGTLTGSAMNPARGFGPALVSMDFANHWIYWVGPILGGLIAAWTYNFIFLNRTETISVPT